MAPAALLLGIPTLAIQEMDASLTQILGTQAMGRCLTPTLATQAMAVSSPSILSLAIQAPTAFKRNDVSHASPNRETQETK